MDVFAFYYPYAYAFHAAGVYVAGVFDGHLGVGCVEGAGVLVVEVTQLKGKGAVQYIGVATGMNSLIRPALYGAHHDIVNLTRFGEPGTVVYNVVGPICESADYLGHERLLPPTKEGDVLLIANAGAYGRAMSSS